MAKKDYSGLVKLILILLLVLLVLSLIQNIVKLALGEMPANLVIVIILIFGILWLLSKEGQKKVKALLNEAI